MYHYVNMASTFFIEIVFLEFHILTVFWKEQGDLIKVVEN